MKFQKFKFLIKRSFSTFSVYCLDKYIFFLNWINLNKKLNKIFLFIKKNQFKIIFFNIAKNWNFKNKELES